jgi:adenine deaminase
MPAPPRTPQALSDLIAAGRRQRELDLLVVGGTVLDVYRGEWTQVNVGVAGGRVVSFDDSRPRSREVIDATGRWIVPGLFDPHFHAGGCHLSPSRLAEALLARGTTTTVCDFQEHYGVAGPEAVRAALDEALDAGLRMYYLVPLQSFVVRALGISGHEMVVDDLRAMLDWPETVAINEPPPGAVFAGDDDTLEIVAEALRRRLIYSGHAPEYAGADLQAYVATGPSSDHESTTAQDAWMKLALGMKVIMRQGSAAPDLPRLVELAAQHPMATRHMSFGTDEVDPVDLEEYGHQDGKVRYAISQGVDAIVAYQMATLNPAEYYRVDHEIGSLAPGRAADMLVLRDAERVDIETVIASGVVVDRSAPRPSRPPSQIVRSVVRYGRELRAGDFALPASGASARVRTIDVPDGLLVSGAGEATLPVVDGNVSSDAAQDALKIASIDRFTGRSQIGLAFTRGFGFSDGAVATTYQHPYFNVLVVGTSDEAIALAANRMAELGGGMTVVSGGAVVADWQLETIGVFSDEPLHAVRREFEAANEAIRALGCPLKAPVLALSFAGLPTIPAYGLSAKGLYDVLGGCFVSPFAGEST